MFAHRARGTAGAYPNAVRSPSAPPTPSAAPPCERNPLCLREANHSGWCKLRTAGRGGRPVGGGRVPDIASLTWRPFKAVPGHG